MRMSGIDRIENALALHRALYRAHHAAAAERNGAAVQAAGPPTGETTRFADGPMPVPASPAVAPVPGHPAGPPPTVNVAVQAVQAVQAIGAAPAETAYPAAPEGRAEAPGGEAADTVYRMERRARMLPQNMED